MLKVFFHPGPYKTGTTSIQQYLRRAIGSEVPKPIWYPMTTGASPGHVEIFNDLNGRNESYQGLLEKLITTAKEHQVEKLIISQEDFCSSEPEVFKKIRDACSGLHLHLIMTHRSLKRRVVSQWQELIKHGETLAIDDLCDVLLIEPFNPNLMQSISGYLLPDQGSIVTSGLGEPGDSLIRRFIDCLDVEDYIEEFGNGIDSDIKINVGHGRVETEFLRHLNIMSKYLNEIGIEHDYKFMRRRLVNMMQSPQWREKCSRLPLQLPAEMEESVSLMAKEIFDNLYKDVHEGKVAVYGNLNHLLE